MRALRSLHLWSLVEGGSLLVLVLVAMPLKYLAAMPLAVRIVGSVHGIAFLLFLLALMRAASERKWPARTWLPMALASLLPGGVLFLHRRVRREQATAAGEAPAADRAIG